MNLEEHTKDVERKYKESVASIKTISDLDIAEEVSHVNENTIFIKDRVFDDNMLLLTEMRKTLGLVLLYYYMNGNSLATRYSDGVTNFILFSTDAGNALKRISGGKCKIETRASEEQEVVCSIGSET